MSFIEEISPAEATGELDFLYKEIAGARGGVARVMTCHSLKPALMKGHFEFYKKLMFGKGILKRKTRELIGVVVSAANGCAYCVSHHTQPLRAYKVDEALLSSLGEGLLPESMLDPATLALLRYARRLTEAPEADEAAIEGLRAQGWGDEAILEATLICGYFNFVNRVVVGLGVNLEADFEETCKPELG